MASLAVWAHGASENWECKTWSWRTYMTGCLSHRADSRNAGEVKSESVELYYAKGLGCFPIAQMHDVL